MLPVTRTLLTLDMTIFACVWTRRFGISVVSRTSGPSNLPHHQHRDRQKTSIKSIRCHTLARAWFAMCYATCTSHAADAMSLWRRTCSPQCQRNRRREWQVIDKNWKSVALTEFRRSMMSNQASWSVLFSPCQKRRRSRCVIASKSSITSSIKSASSGADDRVLRSLNPQITVALLTVLSRLRTLLADIYITGRQTDGMHALAPYAFRDDSESAHDHHGIRDADAVYRASC